MAVWEVLASLGETPAAVNEGRVFLGAYRLTDASKRLAAGESIRVAAPVGESGTLPLLFQDDDYVAVAKPAGIPTVPSLEGSRGSLLDIVARQLGLSDKALHVTSRLDRLVSGVVTLAKSPAAAQRILQAREAGTHARRYVALGMLAPGADALDGAWTFAIGRHRKSALLRAVNGPEAKPARSRVRFVAEAGSRVWLLALAPETGRTHQLRVHASHAGVPLLGDRDYGGAARLVLAGGRVVALARVALHCARVAVPRRGGVVSVGAPVAPEITSLWASLGGSPEAWDTAIECDL